MFSLGSEILQATLTLQNRYASYFIASSRHEQSHNDNKESFVLKKLFGASETSSVKHE